MTVETVLLRGSDFPTVDSSDIGWLTDAQMVEVDRVMIDVLGIQLIQMMENAGRNLAELVLRLFSPATVTVLVGSGGNGGGGLVAARHLANRGVDVSVTLGKAPHALGSVPAQQYGILQQMGVPTEADPQDADVMIDAMIGYRLTGAPRGRIAELITMIEESASRVVSLDTPSGLNVTDGSLPGLAVHADATMTLALPKIGLRDAPQVGDLYVADISVPPSVYDAFDVVAADFSSGTILAVVNAP